MTKSTPRKRRQSPVIQARNALWAKRYEAGETVAEIARTVGLSETAVYQGLMGLVEPRPQGRRWTLPVVPRRAAPKSTVVAAQSERTWCSQCDRNVLRAEADRCGSAWCRARPVAEPSTALCPGCDLRPEDPRVRGCSDRDCPLKQKRAA